jgi:hypothetical protein
MKRWNGSRDLLNEIQDAYERLRTGDTDVEAARCEASFLKAAAKVFDIKLAHARVTNRLASGSDVLPGFTLSDDQPTPALSLPSLSIPSNGKKTTRATKRS